MNADQSRGLDLAGQVAVVTGGAAGIGLAAARSFASRGAHVVIADIDADAAEDAAEAIGGTSVHCDVTSEDDLILLGRTASEIGEVGLVMANAGVALGGSFTSIPIAEWSRVLEINVIGVVRTLSAFLDAMIARGNGHVVITGSSASFFGHSSGFDGPYAASKHALFGLAKALARQVSTSGVNVHFLAPRLTDTDFPRRAKAWNKHGSFITTNAPVDNADSVDDVVTALLAGIANNDFLIALDPTTTDQLEAFARDPRP